MTFFSYLNTKICKTRAYLRKAYENLELLISFFVERNSRRSAADHVLSKRVTNLATKKEEKIAMRGRVPSTHKHSSKMPRQNYTVGTISQVLSSCSTPSLASSLILERREGWKKKNGEIQGRGSWWPC
jgi:hypothetical protein